ncbi:hypothetical protein [Engelhardtia mirabilis]|uniref:Uncharacterized protein n=1 Tax=Engelhardtia mirabilis TaxID=2528011 RepID=A0A518BJ42_9BACT|nr:hypothetical protein Pla133_20780 [Planctomycetes bacterium Pla133]QDV01328.1 hypothetical protein Pla86_20780 [Planctomycetes bacterium Pla86]
MALHQLHASRSRGRANDLLTTLLACGAALLASCSAPRPTPEAWLDVGFRTPEQCFRTFQTAFATDQEDLEYRCLATSMKLREGIDSATYRIARDELLSSTPGLKRVAAAKVRRSWPVGADRWALVAEVKVLWIHRFLLVELVTEEFFELYVGERRVLDGAVDLGRNLFLDESEGKPLLWAWVDVEDPLGLATPVDPDAVDELRVGREWKIDSLLPLEREQAEELIAKGS